MAAPGRLLLAALCAAGVSALSAVGGKEKVEVKGAILKDRKGAILKDHKGAILKDSLFDRAESKDAILKEGTDSLDLKKKAEALGAIGGHKIGGHNTKNGRQTPEDVGFSGGVSDAEEYQASLFSESYCLDLGAKGFPLPVFKMLQESNWDASKYWDKVAALGYADDALQPTGPQEIFLKVDCMRQNGNRKTKHIFVGDSQMMALRNAFHRYNGCPEVYWRNSSKDMEDIQEAVKRGDRIKIANGRFHASTDQVPKKVSTECKEGGIASFIYWDAWAEPEIPVQQIQHEIELVGANPDDGDTVVVWVGSNFITAGRRRGVLIDTIDKLHALGVKMVWDSPTYQDEAIIAAASTKDLGTDAKSGIPISYTAISRRKEHGELGSNEYKTEKAFFAGGVEIPMTKRWQLTNRYRGLQCDGMHTDMSARDPLFYDMPCPKGGPQAYGKAMFCPWVEPFKSEVQVGCPRATGLDDLVLQSGLYALCAAHESPFCYAHTEYIR